MSPTMELQPRFSHKIATASPPKRKTSLTNSEAHGSLGGLHMQSQITSNMDNYLLNNNIDESVLDNSPMKAMHLLKAKNTLGRQTTNESQAMSQANNFLASGFKMFEKKLEQMSKDLNDMRE